MRDRPFQREMLKLAIWEHRATKHLAELLEFDSHRDIVLRLLCVEGAFIIHAEGERVVSRN